MLILYALILNESFVGERTVEHTLLTWHLSCNFLILVFVLSSSYAPPLPVTDSY